MVNRKKRKRLLVASSYHHVLTAIAKIYTDSCPFDLLITNSWTYDGYWDSCLSGLDRYGWFEKIFFYNERDHRPPSPTHVIDVYRYELKGEKMLLATIPGLDLCSYELIYLVNENMFPGSTVVRMGLPYVLIEDTTNVFSISKTAPSRLMRYTKEQILKLYKVCDVLNYWHKIYGYADNCQAIEVSSLDVNFALPDKLKLVDRRTLISSIPEEDKTKIISMFLDGIELAPLFDERSKMLILTCPCVHGITNDELKTICGRLIESYSEEGQTVFVKPHPRDITDYSDVSENVIMLPRTFPVEIFNYDNRIFFDTAVTVGSTALESLSCIDKKHYLSFEEALATLNISGGSTGGVFNA